METRTITSLDEETGRPLFIRLLSNEQQNTINEEKNENLNNERGINLLDNQTVENDDGVEEITPYPTLRRFNRLHNHLNNEERVDINSHFNDKEAIIFSNNLVKNRLEFLSNFFTNEHRFARTNGDFILDSNPIDNINQNNREMLDNIYNYLFNHKDNDIYSSNRNNQFNIINLILQQLSPDQKKELRQFLYNQDGEGLMKIFPNTFTYSLIHLYRENGNISFEEIISFLTITLLQVNDFQIISDIMEDISREDFNFNEIFQRIDNLVVDSNNNINQITERSIENSSEIQTMTEETMIENSKKSSKLFNSLLNKKLIFALLGLTTIGFGGKLLFLKNPLIIKILSDIFNNGGEIPKLVDSESTSTINSDTNSSSTVITTEGDDNKKTIVEIAISRTLKVLRRIFNQDSE